MRGLARLISSAIRSWANTGPRHEAEAARLPSADWSITSEPRMSDGIRSGVNWMRARGEAEDGAEGLDQLGLGEAGNADEQAVAAGEDGDQRPLDDGLLAVDDLADGGPRRPDPGDRGFGLGDDAVGVGGKVGLVERAHRTGDFPLRFELAVDRAHRPSVAWRRRGNRGLSPASTSPARAHRAINEIGQSAAKPWPAADRRQRQHR